MSNACEIKPDKLQECEYKIGGSIEVFIFALNKWVQYDNIRYFDDQCFLVDGKHPTRGAQVINTLDSCVRPIKSEADIQTEREADNKYKVLHEAIDALPVSECASTEWYEHALRIIENLYDAGMLKGKASD